MNITEHDRNILTKQPSSVEKYLLRIIQRYFDIQYVETQQSIEAIVVEALTRMKRDILHEKSFVFDINGRAGHVTLTTADIRAEPAFTKKSAFNKDFSSSSDTICEGNDIRLSDTREPLPHNHNSNADVIGMSLQSLLQQARQVKRDSEHTHINESVLERLEYTGNANVIDLIKVELLEASLQDKLDRVNGLYDALPEQINTITSSFKEIEEQAKEYLQIVNSLNIDPPQWYIDAITYIDKNIKQIIDRCDNTRANAVTQEEFNSFQNSIASKSMRITSTEINDIPNNTYNDSYNGSCFQSTYTNTITANPDEIIERVDAFLHYSLKVGSDTVDIQTPLPFVEMSLDNKSSVLVDCKWDNRSITLSIKTIFKPTLSSDGCIVFDDRVITVESFLTSRKHMELMLEENGGSLCTISSQNKLNAILPLLVSNSTYAFNAHGYFNYNGSSLNGWYIDEHKIEEPMTFMAWDTDDPEYNSYGDGKRYVYLSTSSNKMITRSAVNPEKVKFIYEYKAKHLTDFVLSPSISLKIYTRKGELE